MSFTEYEDERVFPLICSLKKNKPRHPVAVNSGETTLNKILSDRFLVEREHIYNNIAPRIFLGLSEVNDL